VFRFVQLSLVDMLRPYYASLYVALYSAISWQEQVTLTEMIMIFALHQTNMLSWTCFNSLKQQPGGRRHVAPFRHRPDSEPTKLCSFSLMLHA